MPTKKTKKKAARRAASARPVADATRDLFAGDPEITPDIQRAFEQAVAKYAHRPGVTGIDVGLKMKAGRHTARMAIRIHVEEKFPPRMLRSPQRFPRSILGVPVDVIEAVYQATGGGAVVAPAITGPAHLIRPGLSISLANGPVGTIGPLVVEPSQSAACLLSAGHVIAAGSQTSPGAPVIQPGRDDGGTPQDVIAHLARVNPATDTAFAVLALTRPFQPRPEGAAVDIVGARLPRVGDVLEKSGRSTGITRARVDGLGHYYGVRFAFRLVPLPGDMQPICLGGDSGALWYDGASGHGVGLHCKGGLLPVSAMNFGVATSLPHALSYWGLTLLPPPPP